MCRLAEYSSPAEAAEAIQTLTEQELGGRAVHIRLDRSNIENSGGHSIFVGNLPWSTTDAHLSDLFANWNPYDAHVKTTMSGRSRYCACIGSNDYRLQLIKRQGMLMSKLSRTLCMLAQLQGLRHSALSQ